MTVQESAKPGEPGSYKSTSESGQGKMSSFLALPKTFVYSEKTFSPPFRNHLTASKIAAFFGQDDYASAIEMARQVFSQVKLPKKKINPITVEAMEHGKKYEPYAAEVVYQLPYFDHYDKLEREFNGLWSVTGGFQHLPNKETFILSATPDMLLRKFTSQGYAFQVPVEIKCPWGLFKRGTKLTWAHVKTNYWIQLMVQCLLVGSQTGFLVMFVPYPSLDEPDYTVYRLRTTHEAEEYVLDHVYQTYLRARDADKDFKNFVFKKGEKLKHTETIQKFMRETLTKVA